MIEKLLFRAKEYVVLHTGSVGKRLEKAVAKKWIENIEDAVDQRSPYSFYGIAKRTNPFPQIGMAVHSLEIGGGELFPIFLANALYEAGCRVVLLNCGMAPENSSVREMILPNLPVVDLKDYTQIPEAVSRYHLDVIHSHHATIDLAVSRMISTGKMNVRQIITLHGMYEALDKPRTRLLIERVINTCNCFAYIADKNLLPFYALTESEGSTGMPIIREDDRVGPRFIKVPNGLPCGIEKGVTRQNLSIPDNAFVLCLVSRARPEKGWKEAIQIVKVANRYTEQDIHLILVGNGVVYDELKNIDDSHIHFVGYQKNTRQYFAISDMGFLPSTYRGESFPLVIIDCLMCGKPVVATRLGEIYNMLQTKNGAAGWTFELEDGSIPIQRVAKFIIKISNTPKAYERMRRNARIAACHYRIDAVADQYKDIYQIAYSEVKKTEKKSVQILISAHKPVMMLHSSILHPIQVGCDLTENRLSGSLYDNTGDNISLKNRSYCELTAQYWAWKNIHADYYGFFHYRRYLNLTDRTFPEDKYGNVYEPSYGKDNGRCFIKKYGLCDDTILGTLDNWDVVTAGKKTLMDSEGRPQSVREHYKSADFLHIKDLTLIEQIVLEKYPDYLEDIKRYLDGNEAYFCNMYILRRDIFFNYCGWLFDILSEFENRCDMSGYDKQELRTPGHLSERLWGIYLTKLKREGECRIKEAQSVIVAHTEKVRGLESLLPMDAIRKMNHRIGMVR